MSVVLATDTYDTVQSVVAAFRRQTVRHQIEMLIVAPSGDVDARDRPELSDFAAVRVLTVDRPLSLARARAAGVRAASAPFVFIGETHSFPLPTMVEVLLSGHDDERCAAIVPAIQNAQQASAISWASHLFDYGAWGEGRPAGRLQQPLLHNGAYRRSALLELGDRLDDVLDVNCEDLWPLLHGRGYHARFEPAARTDHVSASSLRVMLRIGFLAGTLIGLRRARSWRVWRRAVYIILSPLIPLLLVLRVRSVVPFGAPGRRLPAGTMFAVAAGAVAKILGEVIGYLGIAWPSAEARLTDNELHKMRHARPGLR